MINTIFCIKYVYSLSEYAIITCFITSHDVNYKKVREALCNSGPIGAQTGYVLLL